MDKKQFFDSSHLTLVPVSELKIGMFVAWLDRDWLETPFLTQGFFIRTHEEIRQLQELCKYVYIEKEENDQGKKKQQTNTTILAPSKKRSEVLSIDVAQNNGTHIATPARKDPKKPLMPGATNKTSLAAAISKRPRYKIQTDAAHEHQVSKVIYREARKVASSLLEQARLGKAVESETAKTVVKGCVKSILRNPDALMWMAKIKHADNYTMEHCLNVCILAIAFGRHLRLPQADIEQLGLAGLLHDVGKMRIPDAVINKPGHLTDEEFEVMKSHTTCGRDLLINSHGINPLAIEVATSHHERVDAQGYPQGKSSTVMSDFVRMISIVDSFDAMTSQRCYCESKSTLEALRELFKARGKQFDEELALEFIQMIGPYPPGTIVELKNGCVGFVLSSDEKKRHLPKVKIVLDKNKQKIEPYLIDLLETDKGDLCKLHLISHVLKEGSYGLHLEEYQVSSRLQLGGASSAANPSNEAE